MEDKYDSFFRSIKEFALGLEFVDCRDGSCKNKISIDNSYCFSINSFLSNFNDQVAYANNGLGSSFFDVASILKSQERASEKKITLNILEVNQIGGWDERDANFDGCELLFLKYDSISSSYMFVDNNVENPIVYIYWEGGEITSDDLVFTSYVRSVLFWEIIRGLDQSTNNHKLERISWIRFYSWFIQRYKNARNKLVGWRYEFNLYVEKNKIENKDLLGVDEFEVEFIKYLIEKKGVEISQDIFNPYSNIVTYKDYL